MARLSIAKLEHHLYAAADILRHEGMGAATSKNHIFGLLFLKRCTDVFEPENDYGENPVFYNDFFVPPRESVKKA